MKCLVMGGTQFNGLALVRELAKHGHDVKEADVQVLLDPPWDQSMMSDVARLQLGLM